MLEPMEEGQFWIDEGEEGPDSHKDMWRRENIDEKALDNILRGQVQWKLNETAPKG